MRDKLIELLSEDFVEFCNVDIIAGNCKIRAFTFDADRFADHLIANGVTIPVRCKDCKHYMTIHCTCDGCCISDDWYCADGERRTDESDR